MTHWLEFGEADFDAARAPAGAAKRAAATADQPGLFFVATPATRPARRTDPGQLPGQVPIFDVDDNGPAVICAPNLLGFCRTCGRDMQADTDTEE